MKKQYSYISHRGGMLLTRPGIRIINILDQLRVKELNPDPVYIKARD